MTNVVNLDGTDVEHGKPNPQLIDVLKKVLAMAEGGQLQSYIGTGFTDDGLRVATWCDHHIDVYQQLGALAWLQAEYIDKHVRG